MAYAVTANNEGPGDILGNGKLDSNAHKIFRLVRFVPTSGNDNSVGLTTDSVVVWDTTSDDGVTVTTTTTSGDNGIAGVIVSTALTPEFGALGSTAAVDAGRRNWCWLQTYGLATPFAGTSLTSAVNDKFGTSTTVGAVSTFTQTVTQSGGVSGWGGAILDAVSTNTPAGKVDVFLKGID